MRDLIDAEVESIGDMEMLDDVLISPRQWYVCASSV